MTITVAASVAGSGFSTNPIDLTLSSTEGNLQVVMFGHRTSSLTPSITGTGWSVAFLIETAITNANNRRALVMYWRVVPAGQSTTVTVDWSATSAKAAVGYELATDTAGGTWSFDETTGRTSNDSGNSAVASLPSNAVTPEFAEAFAVDAVVTRHGAPSDEDSYSDAFTTGVGDHEGTGSTNIAVFSGYKIVDVAPAAMSTTASWTTSALATSIIGVWSVSAAGGQNLTDTQSDDTSLTDATALDQDKNLVDDTGLVDQATPALDIVRDAADDVTVTDTITVELVTATSDDTGLTDTVTTSLFTALAETADDTVGLTDTVDAQLFRLIDETADDGVAVTDVVAVEQGLAVTDDVALADAVILDLGPAVTDQAGLTDTLAVDLTVVLTDSAGLTDTAVGFDPENLARSIVTSQGTHSLTASAAGTFQLTATASGTHDLIVETEGAL